jgi:hypothetical protein
MTEEPARQDIEELVRRLENGPFPLDHIREAGQILVSIQSHPASYRMALEFWESRHAQVRTLGMTMMEALAPHLEGARGFVAGAKDAAAGLAAAGRPNVPDYSAIGEVIKMWMRESRQAKRRR